MMDRQTFKAEVDRLYAAFGRPPAKSDSLSAWYAELPQRIGPERMRWAVTQIIRESDVCPQNVVRAIVQYLPGEKKQEIGDELSPVEAARNRNRLKVLLTLHGRKLGDPMRDALVALEGAALLKDVGLDWRDPRIQSRYKPVLSKMQEAHDTMAHTAICTAMTELLDQYAEKQ